MNITALNEKDWRILLKVLTILGRRLCFKVEIDAKVMIEVDGNDVRELVREQK